MSSADPLAPDFSKLLKLAREETTPVLLIDLAIIEAKLTALRAALPGVQVFYAVKANSLAPVIARLAALGCSFDIASPGELSLCQSIAGPEVRLSYGHPIKKEADIADAYARGVRLYSVDSEMELDKIARAAPGSEVFCRLGVSGAGAEWPLTHKFGCTTAQAVGLLVRAGQLGLKPAGVSFHVGSQQDRPEAWRLAIHRAGEVFHPLARQGVALRFVNLGGGLPGHYAHETPPLADYAQTIEAALKETFGERQPELLIEPGRYMVADAGVLVSEVVLVAERPHERLPTWVYLDVGVYGGLDETAGEKIRYRLDFDARGRPLAPVVLAGPTCDSADVLYRHGVQLPVGLQPGERISFLSAGAYTADCSMVSFNGFAPLKARCVD